ncbi:hypothetical protein HAP94_01545 [Acidithiobacillus ferrivorans]|nr:hypothetical protein [Acidithiobacillus ferrivorans]
MDMVALETTEATMLVRPGRLLRLEAAVIMIMGPMAQQETADTVAVVVVVADLVAAAVAAAVVSQEVEVPATVRVLADMVDKVEWITRQQVSPLELVRQVVPLTVTVLTVLWLLHLHPKRGQIMYALVATMGRRKPFSSRSAHGGRLATVCSGTSKSRAIYEDIVHVMEKLIKKDGICLTLPNFAYIVDWFMTAYTAG